MEIFWDLALPSVNIESMMVKNNYRKFQQSYANYNIATAILMDNRHVITNDTGCRCKTK